MAYDDRDLAGVGGWLAFFVISIAILTPLRVILSTTSDLYGNAAAAAVYGDAWLGVQVGEWCIAAAAIAILWFMAWRLMKVENWKTVRIVIAGLWIVGIGAPLADIMLIAATGMFRSDMLGELFGAQIALPLVYDTIWTAYFLRSRRVANTYPREGTVSEVAEIFS